MDKPSFVLPADLSAEIIVGYRAAVAAGPGRRM